VNILKSIKEYISNKPKVKKILGIILILVGFVLLITPFTPGACVVIIIGLELSNIRVLFFDKFKFWKKK